MTPEQIKAAVSYEPETGRFFWLPRTADWFAGDQARANTWNKKFAGKETFLSNDKGYRRVCIFDKFIYAHRAAWAITHGYWPEGEVDHIDGNRANNRLTNLRPVTRLQNMSNFACHRAGKHPGIRWKNNRWLATIAKDKRSYHLGSFTNLDDAIAARKAAELEHFGSNSFLSDADETFFHGETCA